MLLWKCGLYVPSPVRVNHCMPWSRCHFKSFSIWARQVFPLSWKQFLFLWMEWCWLTYHCHCVCAFDAPKCMFLIGIILIVYIFLVCISISTNRYWDHGRSPSIWERSLWWKWRLPKQNMINYSCIRSRLKFISSFG